MQIKSHIFKLAQKILQIEFIIRVIIFLPEFILIINLRIFQSL